MKRLLGLIIFLLCIATLLPLEAHAQDRTVTIFLVRHAEKDTTDKTDTDPALSDTGKERAERLRKVLSVYRPNRILSTDTERTRETAGPLAKKRNLKIEIYDPRKLPEVAEFLKGLRKNRKVVVVGHSNTTAALANILFGSKSFNNLDESEYDKLFIIRMKKGRIRVEVRTF